MTSLSIILTVFVLQLHHVGPHKRPVPGWLRTLVCKVFARMVCMSRESHPFSKRQSHQNQIKCYIGAGGGENGEQGNDRVSSPHPRVIVESCDTSSVTHLHRDRDGRVDAPPYEDCGGIVGDGNGRVSATSRDSAHLIGMNTTPTLLTDFEKRVMTSRTPEGNAIIKASHQGGNINSSRGNKCNGELFLHQRDRIAPVNISDLGQTSLEISDPSRQGGGLQCREYTFHEPEAYTHGYDQVGRGSGGRISRSPSFRSRSNSFRGDNFRGSFCAGYPVVSDGATSLESPIAAGSGGIHLGSAYTGSSSYDAYQQLVMEWQFIAHVMDRLLFWLFLFVALISSIAILVIKPLFKPPLDEDLADMEETTTPSS